MANIFEQIHAESQPVTRLSVTGAGSDEKLTTPAAVNNNPGNLRDPKTGEFRRFASPEEGFSGLIGDIEDKQAGRTPNSKLTGESSLYDFAEKFAPTKDKNNPVIYAQNLSKHLGVPPETPIGQLASHDLAVAVSKNEDGPNWKAIEGKISAPQASKEAPAVADTPKKSGSSIFDRIHAEQNTPTPEPRTFWDDVADTAKEYWKRTGQPVVDASQYFNTDPAAHQKAVDAIHGFVEGIKGIPLQTQRALEATGREMVKGHPVQAATEAIGAIPVVGPQSLEIGSDLAAGDIKGAVAHTGAMVTPFVAPSVTRGVTGATEAALEAAPQALRTTGRVIKGAAVEGGKALIKKPVESAALAAAGHYIAGPEGAAVGTALGAIPSAIRGGIEAYRNEPLPSSVPPIARSVMERTIRNQAPRPQAPPYPSDVIPPEGAQLPPEVANPPAAAAPAEVTPALVDAKGQPIPTLDELAAQFKRKSYAALNVEQKAWVDKVKASLDRTAVAPPEPAPVATPQAATQPPAAPPIGADYVMPEPQPAGVPIANTGQPMLAPGQAMPPQAFPQPEAPPASAPVRQAHAVSPAEPSSALGAYGVDEPLVFSRARVQALAKDNGISEVDQLKILRDEGYKIQDDPFASGKFAANRRGKVTSAEPMKPETKAAPAETKAVNPEVLPPIRSLPEAPINTIAPLNANGIKAAPEPTNISNQNWYADRGARPGEPSFWYPADSDLETSRAAITEVDHPEKGSFTYKPAIMMGDEPVELGEFNTPEEAAAAAEQYMKTTVQATATPVAEVLRPATTRKLSASNLKLPTAAETEAAIRKQKLTELGRVLTGESEPTSGASKAIAAIEDKFPADSANPSQRVFMVGGKPALKFELAEREGRLRLKTMESMQPGNGVGSLALKRLLKIADENGVTVEATASPYGKNPGRMDKGALLDFYKRNGFELEPGHDESLGYIIRKPQSAKLTKAEIDKLPAKQAVEYLKRQKSGK